MRGIRINFGALGVYFFGLALVYLAGLSMAGVLFYLFLFYLLFPLVSLILLVIVNLKFRYYENFSTDHPVKGQGVVYTLSLANETPLAEAHVLVRFRITSPDASLSLPPLRAVVNGNETRRATHSLSFPYRGIYEVGISSIEITDRLGWLKFYPSVWFRTFYVYPRVIELDSVFPRLQNVVEASGSGLGIINDHSLYRQLAEYRGGESVKHMAWKKFAATGAPFLREYEKTSWPGAEIYLDLRREEDGADHAVLEREDCSIEILVSLVSYFLKKSILVNVHAYNGRDRLDFSGNDEAAFDGFYKSTIFLTFTSDCSPAAVFLADVQDRLIKTGTVIFITHRMDPDVLELVLDKTRSDMSVFAIINHTGVDAGRKRMEKAKVKADPSSAGNVVFVDNILALKEAMQA